MDLNKTAADPPPPPPIHSCSIMMDGKGEYPMRVDITVEQVVQT